MVTHTGGLKECDRSDGVIKMNDKKTNEKSCWNCSYQNIAGVPFFGKCTWFSKKNKGEDKEIQSDIVDIGCKYFIPRKQTFQDINNQEK